MRKLIRELTLDLAELACLAFFLAGLLLLASTF